MTLKHVIGIILLMLIVIIIKIKVIKYTFIVHTVSEMCKPKCHGGSNNTTHPIGVILHQEVC